MSPGEHIWEWRAKSVMAVDPGERTGVCVIKFGAVSFHTFALHDLPRQLFQVMSATTPIGRRPAGPVVCESFHLRPHQARQQAGSAVPAAEAIGALRATMYAFRRGEPSMCPPNMKQPGREFVSRRYPDLFAYKKNASSVHERDAFDLACYALREDYIRSRT